MCRGQYQEAFQIFNSTPLEQNPSLLGFYKPNALFRLGRSDEASALIEQVLKHHPNLEARGTGLGVNFQTRFGYRQARAESCAAPSPVMLLNPAIDNKSDRQLCSLMPDRMPPLRADRSKAREPLPHPLFLKNQAAFRLPAA